MLPKMHKMVMNQVHLTQIAQTRRVPGGNIHKITALANIFISKLNGLLS